jgi:iron complex transport system permease protein
VTETAKVPVAATPEARGGLVRVRGPSWVWTISGTAFFLAAVVTGALVGPVSISGTGIFREALSHVPFVGVTSPLSGFEEAIVTEIRLPRVVLGALVGAMLSGAGAAYQGVFRNPLADPFLLGVAAGAGLGATLAVAYGSGDVAGIDVLPLAAFAGAGVAVVLAYVLGRAAAASGGPAALVLAGVTVASFLTAVQTFVQQQHTATLQEVYAWILGRLATSGWDDVVLILPYVGASALVLLLHRRLLDVLTLGDEEAASLGVNVARVRLIVVVAATIGTAAAVAVSGLIGFLGIIVPHAIRLVGGGSYRLVLPLSLLVGAGFLVFADVLARTILAPAELPIGVVTAFFGAPFFAVVLRTSRVMGR